MGVQPAERLQQGCSPAESKHSFAPEQRFRGKSELKIPKSKIRSAEIGGFPHILTRPLSRSAELCVAHMRY